MPSTVPIVSSITNATASCLLPLFDNAGYSTKIMVAAIMSIPKLAKISRNPPFPILWIFVINLFQLSSLSIFLNELGKIFQCKELIIIVRSSCAMYEADRSLICPSQAERAVQCRMRLHPYLRCIPATACSL